MPIKHLIAADVSGREGESESSRCAEPARRTAIGPGAGDPGFRAVVLKLEA